MILKEPEMTINEFREKHSYLIEQYQYIEWNLEGIYAFICKKRFLEGLKDVERTNPYRLLVEIEKIEQETKCPVFTDGERQSLRTVIQRRNYWVHNCYIEILFERKTDNIKKQSDIDELINDIRATESLRQRIFEIKSKMVNYNM